MSNLDKAIEIFNQGGIVVFPTDTVWGIGCRLDKPESIEKLFEIRKRPLEKAVPVLVSSIEQAKKYYDNLPIEIEDKLLKRFWPGGLTVIYKCKTDLIPHRVRGGGNTIGLRMPNNQNLLYLINNVGVPVLGPSANFSGDPTPTAFSKLNPELIKLVDFVLEGECGGNKASTVVDCTVEPWNIIRQGAVEIGI